MASNSKSGAEAVVGERRAPPEPKLPGPPRPKRRRLRAEERREEILRAAMTVFAERGYQGASMAVIASAAGISPAVIYDHFESKAQLQITLLERETEALFGFVAEALAASPPVPAEMMRRGMDAFFAYVEREQYAWRMLFREPPAGSDIGEAYDTIRARTTQGLSGFIRLGAPPGLFDDPESDTTVEMFAEMMRVAQQTLAVWWWEHKEVPRSEVVDRIIEFCWIGLERVAQGERAGEG